MSVKSSFHCGGGQRELFIILHIALHSLNTVCFQLSVRCYAQRCWSDFRKQKVRPQIALLWESSHQSFYNLDHMLFWAFKFRCKVLLFLKHLEFGNHASIVMQVYYKLDRLLTGLKDQQKVTTVRWD